MARASRNASLETRSARNRLKIRSSLYWAPIGAGLALGYAKGKKASTWFVRIDTGKVHSSGQKKYRLDKLKGVKPNDFEDADGKTILSYFQAQERAREFAEGERNRGEIGVNVTIYTVAEVMADYLQWFQVNAKSYRQTKYVVDARILPALGDKKVTDLTTRIIRVWFNGLVNTEADDESIRRSKSTANRVLTVLKAALNFAYQEGAASSREAWLKVKPFKGVDQAKIRYLTEAECKRLLNACDPAFRKLVHAALLTGCRYGELISAKTHDFNRDAGVLTIPKAKSGKPRHIPLTAEGVQAFTQWTAGNKGGDLIFTREDGEFWGKSHQARRIKIACSHASIDPPCSFHNLRDAYASLLVKNGVGLQVVAEALGHSDIRMTQKHYAHLQPGHVAAQIRANLPAFGLEETNVRPIQ